MFCVCAVPLAPNSAANRVQTILTTEMEEEVVLFWDCGRKSKPLRDLALGQCLCKLLRITCTLIYSYSFFCHPRLFLVIPLVFWRCALHAETDELLRRDGVYLYSSEYSCVR